MDQPYWPSKLTKYSINRLAGHNMTQSALMAGYSPSMANIAGRAIEPKHQESIKDALNLAGATNSRLACVIVDGLSANDAEGNVNYRERREYTKLALEAKGELKSGNTVAVQINFPAGLVERWAKDE
jgi:hypothetical protein